MRALYERPTQLKRHPGRRGGRGDLPEAGARAAARLDRDGARALPVRAARRRAVRDRARPGDLGGQPRNARLPSLAVAACATSSSPTSCASTSTLSRARASPRRSGSRRSCTRCSPRSATSAGRRRPGNRGIHVACRIEPHWDVPRRAPLRARVRPRGRAARSRRSSRPPGGRRSAGERVFIDYNQNARDRTIASAYSVRARPDATVSAPVTWDELPDVETEDFTIATMPARFAALGDLHARHRRRGLRPPRAARVGRARRAGGPRRGALSTDTSRRCPESRPACSPRGRERTPIRSRCPARQVHFETACTGSC